MALNSSSTFNAVLAEVSMKKRPLSLAYSLASCVETKRESSRGVLRRHQRNLGRGREHASEGAGGVVTELSTFRLLARSHLLPARAITMLGLRREKGRNQ